MRREVDEEILDIIPERLVDRLDGHAGSGLRLRHVLTGLLFAAAIAATVAGVYIFLGGSPEPGLGSDVPVIRADSRPIKSRPDDPGGLVVPNQDKLIYEGLGRGEPEARVERLLPPPEEPKPLPVDPPAAPTEVVPEAPQTKPSAPPLQQAAPPVQPAPAIPAPVVTPTPPSSPKTPAAAEALPARTPTGQEARGEFMIQLAAMGTLEAAQKEWVRVKKANADLLGSLASDIVKVDLGQKGVFFRLRAGPMDELSARTLCGQVVKRNVGCMVVRK